MNDYTLYYFVMSLAFLLTYGAQVFVTSTYRKYSNAIISRNITGAQAARMILDANGLYDVTIKEVQGRLTDHYDPRSKEVRLSSANYQGNGVANVAVACHECGHAMQDQAGYAFLRFRNMMVPAVNISSFAGYFVIMLGIVMNYMGLIWIGIMLEMVILSFQLITLPVEFDASSRALKQLTGMGILVDEEVAQGRKVLNAAAMTYVAGVAATLLEIIRLVLRNETEVTGGPNGIGGIPKPTFFGLTFERRAAEGLQTFHEFFGLQYDPALKVTALYLVALLLVLAALFIVNRLMRMPIGRAWEALREDEIACRALGLNPTVIKLSAFTIGASFAGFAGSFFAARQGLVTPESFTFMESAMILAIVVLGGMGSQLGVILAAAVMVLLQEMRGFAEYRMLIFGLMMIVMMIWRPNGLLPMQRPHMELRR